MGDDRLICIGMFLGAHGVRGLVRVASYTEDPMALFSYAPLSDATGQRVFDLACQGKSKDAFLTAVDGITDRDAAQALKGVELYVPRAALPAQDEDAFYLADLVGLCVRDAQGQDYGTVVAVHNYGAGDMIEVQPAAGKSFMLPLQEAFVPHVDATAGFLEVLIPEGWLSNKKTTDDKEDKELGDA